MNTSTIRHTNRRVSGIFGKTSLFLVLLAFFASCSTGIESTKTIRLNKDDMRLMSKTEEQNLAAEIKGSPLSEWENGKPFIAMSGRTLYIFEPTGLTFDDDKGIEGTTLHFTGHESRITPGLNEECILVFSDGNHDYRYPTGKPTEHAMKEIDSSRIPLLSDPALTDKWRDKIKGKTLWTKNNLWYDGNGQRISGLKFAEVYVEDVAPATGDFPVKVQIKTQDGNTAYIHMNYTSDMPDSRSFPAVFFLTDPKTRYPQISDENWKLIQRGRVRNGMTKEECRLAIGNPDELNAGHSTSHTMDIWQYNNGTYLMFTDGLLTRFRQ